jgi:hypothetical protein
MTIKCRVDYHINLLKMGVGLKKAINRAKEWPCAQWNSAL